MTHQDYLNRTYMLARLSHKNVGENPNVGAILVYKDRIIGEGYHGYEGGPHAEVNAIKSVKQEDRHYISDSILYVSLEPCVHHGKTPPCTDLIIDHSIKEIHIGTSDPFSLVGGKGIARLQEKGVSVTVHDDPQAKLVLQPFTARIKKNRPFITLKFAKSKDNFMGKKDKQVWLSNPYTKIHAHQLRAENDAILIGTRTAVIDNPSLTTRAYPGESPIRLVIDKNLIIPQSHKLLDKKVKTVIFNNLKNKKFHNLTYLKMESEDYLPAIMDYCLKHKIYRILVEGGATVLNSFVKNNMWDQAYIYDTQKELVTGITAPNIKGRLVDKTITGNNTISKIISI